MKIIKIITKGTPCWSHRPLASCKPSKIESQVSITKHLFFALQRCQISISILYKANLIFYIIFFRSSKKKKLYDLYFSPNIILVVKSGMRWVGNVARLWERIVACRVLVGKRESRRQLGGPRRRWTDNIQMVVKEIRRD